MVRPVEALIYARPCSIAGTVPCRDLRLSSLQTARTFQPQHPLHAIVRLATGAGYRDVPTRRRRVDPGRVDILASHPVSADYIRVVSWVSACSIPTWPRNHGHTAANDIMDDSLAKRRRAFPRHVRGWEALQTRAGGRASSPSEIFTTVHSSFQRALGSGNGLASRNLACLEV